MLTTKKLYFSDSYIIDVIVVLLGAVLLTLSCSLLFRGLFTAQIFAAKMTDIAQFSGPYVKQFIFLLIANSEIIAPVLGITMFTIAILLILFIARGLMAILMGVGFFIAWILLWRYPGVWTYALLFPTLFAICVGLAKLNHPPLGLSVYHQLTVSKPTQILIILFLSILLGYVTFLSLIHNVMSYKIAISAGLTFLIVSYIHLGIDQWLKNKNIQINISRLASINWIDVMILIIGSMMVAQVYSNYYSALYTVNGFESLGEYYATNTASFWLSPLLSWASHHGSVLLPIYILYEILVAISLVLLIFRGPTTLLAAILFFLLAFAEFGVSSTWPPTPGLYTREWELLLPATVSLLISIGKFEEMYHATTWQEVILGKKIFYSLSLFARMSIVTISAIVLYCAGMITHIFGSPYASISISAAVTFFILLMLLVWMDKYRSN